MMTQTQVQRPSTSARPLHKYVIWMIGLWFLFLGTFVIAYFCVSNSDKYDGLPLKSLTEAQPQRPEDSY